MLFDLRPPCQRCNKADAMIPRDNPVLCGQHCMWETLRENAQRWRYCFDHAQWHMIDDGCADCLHAEERSLTVMPTETDNPGPPPFETARPQPGG